MFTCIAGLYVAFERTIMEYGKNTDISIMLRFFLVFAIQFGMSCLGVLIVSIKNKEKMIEYGLIKKNAFKSIIGCLLFSILTVMFFGITGNYIIFSVSRNVFD